MGYVRVSGTDDDPRFGGLAGDIKKQTLAAQQSIAKSNAEIKKAQARAAGARKRTPQWQVLMACNGLARVWKIDLPTLFSQYQANGYRVWAPWSLGGVAPIAVVCDICAQFMEKNPTQTDKVLAPFASSITSIFWNMLVKQGHPELASNATGLLAMIAAEGVSPATNFGQFSVAAWCLRSMIAGTPDFQLTRTDGSATVASSSNGVSIQPVAAPPPPPDAVVTASGAGTDASGNPVIVDQAVTSDPGSSSGDGTVAPPDDSGGAPVPSSPKRHSTALYVGGGLGVLGLGYLAWKAFKG